MDQLERVKQLLELHQGKGNAISAGEIEQKLGYPTEDTHAKGRKLIERCAKKYGIPVSGDPSGYFIMTNQAELDEYKANLRSRVKKIHDREELMEKTSRSGINEIHT